MNKIMCIVLFATANFVLAQSITPSVIASAGAVMKSNSVSLEWTLGEVVTETKAAGNLIITQGFHQTKIGTTSTKDFTIEGLQIFPNPVQSKLNIINKHEADLNFIFYNMDGQEIIQDKIRLGSQEINMESYPSGTYFLAIKKKDSQQVFTINKIN